MFLPVTLQLLAGFLESLKVFILTLLFSLPLGLVISFGSMSRFRPLKALVRGFVWIIRGTPLMLQLIIIFYGPGLMFDLPSMPRFTATIIAFSVNYACYFSEIYRGGIEGIPRGQYEAAQVLGMTKSQVQKLSVRLLRSPFVRSPQTPALTAPLLLTRSVPPARRATASTLLQKNMLIWQKQEFLTPQRLPARHFKMPLR